MTRNNGHGIYFAISEASGVITAAIGLFVLIGWILNIPLMQSVLPNIVTMKANTAICFILGGVSLWCLQAKRSDKRPFFMLGNICASVMVLVGAITLNEYLFGVGPNIDQIFFKEPTGAVFTTYPGRMALITAFNFFILGIALLSCNVKSKFGSYFSQYLALVAGFVTLSALCGYTYGISTFYEGIAIYTAMALNTAVAFMFLCLGILLVKPHDGLAGIITAREPGGVIIRQLSLVIVLLPIIVGWAVLRGEKAGLYNVQFGTVLAVLVNSALLLTITWWTAASINRMEKDRGQAQRALDAANEEWKLTFDSMLDPAFIIDVDNVVINANSAISKLLGKAPQEIIGKKCYEIMHGTQAPIKNCPLEMSKEDRGSHVEEVNDPHVGVPMLVTTSPIFNKEKGLAGFVHIARDISFIKKSEEALEQKIEELEKFQKVTVDREMKMKELKDRVEQLEAMLYGGK